MDTTVNENDNLKTAAEAERFKTRRTALMRGLKRDVDVDCMLVTNPADIRYLCGATEGIHSLLVMDGEATLHTGEMFRVQAIQESPGTSVQTTAGDLFKQTVDWAADRDAKTVGFQDDHMTVSRHRSLRKAAAKRVKLLRVGGLTATARAVKDVEEIASTRRAVAIAEKAFCALMDRGAAWFIGRTERQIAAELDCLMALDGADAPSFPTIVASGPNSYHCHHVPGTRIVRHGDPLLVDWGAELNGYRSDITRVLFMGSAPDRLATLYSIALSAHDEAVTAIRPRVRCHTVNELARGIIRNAGYDKEFRHGLGHGIGLQVHEHPYFSGRPANAAGVTLKPGMIVTVEPGIYLEGIGGVRIEDDILVTPEGHERLNQLPRSLEAMVLA